MTTAEPKCLHLTLLSWTWKLRTELKEQSDLVRTFWILISHPPLPFFLSIVERNVFFFCRRCNFKCHDGWKSGGSCPFSSGTQTSRNILSTPAPWKLFFLISLATDFGKINVCTEVAFNKAQLISTFDWISFQHRGKYIEENKKEVLHTEPKGSKLLLDSEEIQEHVSLGRGRDQSISWYV